MPISHENVGPTLSWVAYAHCTSHVKRNGDEFNYQTLCLSALSARIAGRVVQGDPGVLFRDSAEIAKTLPRRQQGSAQETRQHAQVSASQVIVTGTRIHRCD